VQWDSPADAHRSWRHERWHTPDAITPLSFDINAGVLYEGFRRAGVARGAPVVPAVRRINCYLYLGFEPPSPDEPVWSEELPASADNHRTWDERWLPETQQSLDRFAAFDLPTADDRALRVHLDETLERAARMWMIHGLIDIGQADFVDLCEELLGADEATASRMLQGFPNKSLEADEGVRRLAASARAEDAVATAFRATPSESLAQTLSRLPQAQGFLRDVDGYLAAFGRRGDNFTELSLPSWDEDPTPLLALVRLQLDDERDYEQRRERLVEERERAIAEARQALAGRPAEVIERFERALSHGQRATMLNEDHNYWIDQQSMHWVRQVLVESGVRCVRLGLIDEPPDVFYLWLAEVRDVLAGEHADLRAAVAERRADLERWRAVDPPHELGRRSPRDAKFERLFGLGLDEHVPRPERAGEVHEVRGQAGSPGTVRARARLIGSIAEAARLAPGEVLVTATTSPPWTPFFAVAGAVVTDAGGSLSHCAIVAREYGIPAVVGCGDATAQIADGMIITVDGSEGVVRIEQ
jgi:pyruvate,water dikinase